MNIVYTSDQRLFILLSFVILVILSFGVHRGKDSNLLAENYFILQVPFFVIYIYQFLTRAVVTATKLCSGSSTSGLNYLRFYKLNPVLCFYSSSF
jgi:hypothetical protein